jgi:hypothetical protein
MHDTKFIWKGKRLTLHHGQKFKKKTEKNATADPAVGRVGVGGGGGGGGGGRRPPLGAPAPYHRDPMVNLKFSMEILRRKKEKEEGGGIGRR